MVGIIVEVEVKKEVVENSVEVILIEVKVVVDVKML